MVTARLETNNHTCAIPFTREQDHLHDLDQLASPLRILPTEILGKLRKGDLRLESHESEFPSLRVNIFNGGGINCNRLIGQTLQS